MSVAEESHGTSSNASHTHRQLLLTELKITSALLDEMYADALYMCSDWMELLITAAFISFSLTRAQHVDARAAQLERVQRDAFDALEGWRRFLGAS
jgi:hypothetical protein